MKKIIFMAAACATLAAPAFAGRDAVGTSGAVFLKIGAGSRPSAMGDAYTAVADDVNAVFYNPSGHSKIKGFEFTAQYGAHFQSIVYNALAAAYPVKNVGTFGVGVINLSVDKIERRVADTAVADDLFGAGDYAYIVSYSRQIASRAAAGANVKYISSKIDDKTASAVAADIGAQWRPSEKLPLTVALAAQNLGGEIKYDKTGDPLPSVAKAGVSYKFLDDTLTSALDIIVPRDNNAQAAVGLEYSRGIDKDFSAAVRAGYKTVTDEKLGGLAGLAAGAGIAYRQFGFDFAWVPYGLLGDTFKYSLIVKF